MAISLLDVKRGSYKPKRIDEEQDEILGQQLANNIISTVNNTAKKTSNALTVKQSKVNTELPKQQTQEEILSDLKNNNTNQINEEGYTDTGKKFGDYYYHDYKTKGQYKIYSKNNHYYYYDEKKQSYIPFTGSESWMTTKEDDEKAYQEAVKAGYKDNSIKDKSGNYLSMENQLKLDTTDLTKEERKQYTEDLFRQQKNKEEENAVQYGGPGLKGSISELQRMGKNIQENLIEPIGRSAENYQYGELNRQLGIEAYKEMMGEKNNLKSVQDKLSKYQKFNEDIISSQNLIDQNTQNLPNQVSGMVEGIKGAGVLGTLGAIGGGVAGAVATKTPQGALVGAEKGAKLLGGAGYTGAQAKSTYELEAGYAYQAMIDMGVPKEIAKEEAQKVGTTNAVIESGETLLDMITMGKASQITGKISEGLAKKYGLETVRNWAKKGVGSYLTNIASEGAEEALQEYSSIQGEKRATKKAGIQRDNSDDLERIKSSAIAGAFGGMVSGAVTRPAGIITNRATNNIINNVANKVSKNQSISTLTQSPVVSNQNNLKNVAQTSIANTVNSFNLGKNVQTVRTNQTFKQSARNYNIDVNNETINSIDKTLSQRGIKARFDSNAFINSNENAFWQLNKDGSREVVFNPNAKTNDLLENVAVHELYHDIFKSKDGQNIKDELLDFAKTKEGYNEARKSLEQLYSNKYDPNSDEFNAFIDEEAVASILGKKLGNQEFVNSLTVEKPSVAKSVYNWVVDKLNKLNKLTGYKSEKLFWKDVKNKFDSAYRSEFNKNNVDVLDNDMFFSKGKLTSGEDVVVSDDINGSRPSNKMAEKTLKKMLGITYVNNSNNNEIIISNKDIKKYLNDGYNNYRNAKLKKRIAGNYGEVIELAKINSSEPNYKNSKRGKQGYDYYDVNLAYPIKDSYGNVMDYKYYTARLVVRKDNNSNFAYDLDKFTEKKGAALDKTSLSITTGKPVSSSFSGNNIPNSNQNVKSGISTKYSMQNSEINAQDIGNNSFNKNIKRYDDLLKTNYIEYFRKDNGDVRVNLMDSNNNIVNQLDLVTTTDAIKQFGERLGNQLYNYATDNNQRIDIGNDINNLGLDTDYFMNHRPTESGITADNLINQNVESPMPKDVYDHPEYYFQMNEKYSKESMNAIRKVRGNPDAEITIYRATPGNKINVGDWITLSKTYAEQHNQSQFNGKANIIEKKVKAKDVQFAGDDINEFGYFPNNKKYSQSNNKWQNFVDKNFKNEGFGHTLSQVKTNQTLNPTEIANLTKEDASTTPKLPNVPVQKGDKQSKFTKNIAEKTKMLTKENRMKLSTEDDVSYYKGITNKQSLDEAYSRLNAGGSGETLSWLSRNSFDKNGKLKQKPTATDVAEGWILLKQYQDAGDYDSMVQVAKVMRQMGTEAGQAVQAYNIMSRLTPEGMVKYAQSELDEAYNQMVKNKTKQWIDKNRDKFTLTPDETAYIVDKIKEASQLPDGYDKKVKLAQIQSLISNKLPPARGAGIKAWMRISMLFNAKTQIRNIMGNAVITPVNAISDTFSALVDRQVAKKTGIRTTGVPNVKNYAMGFKKGLYESYNDFKLDINTRDMQGNRFEIGEGKSFNNKTKIGKTLNQTDRVLSFMLDAGDRPFYEASFINSINNQKILNNTDTVTQDMIDIATTEALQRTWQDNNEYTKFVLNTRRGLNKANIKGYGIGDALIPFAKTPANLTKALVDYSPAGLVTTLVEGKKLKNAIETGSFTPQMQHKFVQNLGKATAGSLLYMLGYALAKQGITTGANDEDKDIADFMKNTLGIQPYSIRIGNHSFTYDWAQPVAAPFAIMADLQKKKEETDTLNKVLSTIDTGANLILQQSFMESIQNVLTNSDGVTSGIMQQILDLPSRAVPTLVKQINDMIDTTQRTSYENDEPIKTAKNKVKNKVPGLSKDLAPSRDSLGREIKKYGGDVNVFNVFLNPANTSKGKTSESAKEIYKIYQKTGDKTIMPRVAPYSIMNGGEKVNLTSKERSEFQKISGQIVEKNIKALAKTSEYKKMDQSYKAETIKSIVDYSYNYAKSKILKQPISRNFKKAYEYTKKGGALYDFYAEKIYKNSKEK